MTGELLWGFAVQRDENSWSVTLPHQCDRWHITNYYQGAPTVAAIADLEGFLAEGQLALDALRRGEVFGEAS